MKHSEVTRNLLRLPALLCSALWLVPAQPSVAQPRQYTVTDLGSVPGRTNVFPYRNSLNNFGRVVGFGFNTQLADEVAWLWDGSLQLLSTWDGTTFTRPQGLNDIGQIVGEIGYSPTNRRAGLWTDGVLNDLGSLTDHVVNVPFSINNLGQVVGGSRTLTDTTLQPVVWSGNQVTALPMLPAAVHGFAFHINEAGQIVGTSGPSIANTRAALWENSAVKDLGTLGGATASAYAINERGQIAGSAALSNALRHAVLWENGAIRDLGTLGGTNSTAYSLNDLGRVVGGARTIANENHAFLWEDGLMIDLNERIPSGSGWVLREATAINNRGQIAGYGLHEGATRAFLLNPPAAPTITTQPTAFPILSLGATVRSRVVATGVVPLSYQWQFNSAALPGKTNVALVLTNLQANQAGDYSVVVTDSTGAVTSQVATLKIDTTFTKITTGPVVARGGDSWGAVWGDYDQDGNLDLFVVNWDPRSGQPDFLFRNNGDGTFAQIREGPVVTDKGAAFSGAFADYDNDGDLDLFVSNAFSNHLLFINDGKGAFTVNTKASLATISGISRPGAWGDFDRDGHLDLYIGGSSTEKGFLYRSKGDGTFLRITNDIVVQDVLAYNVGATWADYDDDGFPDLFVASDEKNRLYHNNGDGSFTKTTGNVAEGGNSQAGVWGDYDNDGDLDLFVSNIGIRNFLYRNEGLGQFVKVTQGIIVEDEAVEAVGATWGDYDNDGFLDLFVAINESTGDVSNALYQNNGNGTFTKITTGSLVLDAAVSTGGAWGDFDKDGFLDLAVANSEGLVTPNEFLYRNSGNSNHWLKLKLVGTSSNRSAIGAKVRLRAFYRGETRWQMRQIGGDCGPGGQNALDVHFGLGDATVADTVRIEWPSGIVQELHNVSTKQFLTVTEPAKLEPQVTQANGLVELKVKSWKGFAYDIEASNDLKSWTRVTTLTNETGTLSFADPVAVGAAQRFYRVANRTHAGRH